MSELFKDIPEFVETSIGESVTARTETLATFRELGPPDLCHVIKSSGSKTAQKDLGSYHYCSGVEASSSASLAAYLNSLQFSVEEDTAWFGKGNGWRVRNGTYCCFNAFSRVDMRVDVKIPGGVDAYVVDLRGDKKLDPITTPEAEGRFLKAAEALFFKGWQLGSDPEIQVATVVTNHLTSAVIKYFADSFRLDRAANLFERMMVNEPEVASLLAKSYIGMNEEIKAVKIMHTALSNNPQSYPILHTQCDFLMSKGKPEWAQQIAQQAVNSAPSEFVTWAKLTETYIELGQFDQALLTLNSCPMFTFNERDLHRMPTPLKTHLPIKKFIAESGILDEESARDNEADVALIRLPAPGLRGTFAKAYSLLTLLVSKIGWDELLKTRSQVFVMEEEYRLHKTTASVELNGFAADENASTAGIRGSGEGAPNTPSDIPTIRISTESTRTPNGTQLHHQKKESQQMDTVLEKPETAQVNDEPNSPIGMKADDASAEGEEEDESTVDQPSAFANKRLCERWLDNLFLVLYEVSELASRLHHKEEAKDAFQRCLDSKFSAKALIKLLEMYSHEGDLQRTLNAAIRLTTWYMDAAYPSMIAHYLFKLGLIHGHAKIQYTLLSMNLPVGIFEIMQGYMKYGAAFNVEGSEF
ncbi:uncharacterized protein L201_005567 [Kwoniella dendrophila CBS 6074]|uniref:ChAPs family protein n=1 Tax=Kwoniella dendrophila CBS 6074 TaxID=1295534 RepID=A0AAX4JYX1_9TREE